MSRAGWFKFYPSDFLDGTRAMTADMVGDYIRLLAFIYDQGGKVPNQPYTLRHLLGCGRAVDAAKRIQRLIDIHKLSTDGDGNLHNGRADREIEKFEQNPAAKGAAKAAKGAANPPSGTPKESTNSTRARAQTRIQKPDNNLVSSAPYVQAGAKNSNGAAAAADGSLGLEGRSPQPPIASARAPPPDKPFPPPSKLMERMKAAGYGKAHKPNGTQRGRNRRNSRKTAAPGRAGEDHQGVAEGTETERPDRS